MLEANKTRLALLSMLYLLLPLHIALASNTAWETLSPGLSTTQLHPKPNNKNATIRAFKIDPKQYQLSIISAKMLNKSALYASEGIKKSSNLIAINGGFFSPNMSMLGLRISNHKVIAPFRKVSWWGIFYVKNQRAKIIPSWKYKASKKIMFALQAGPRILINGKSPKLKSSEDPRSALCITKKGEVILLATANYSPSLTNLARIIKQHSSRGGLDCYNALNLDGGSSTQLFASINKTTYSISSLRPVSDVIIISRRN
jgi:uncharacterized protein YigE (DUF2233 family)